MGGDILLIEHALVSDDIAKIVNIVNQNIEMYLTLCPHDADSQPRNPDVATKKVAANMFRTDGLFALGRQVSMINHSCSPNAMVTYTHIHGFLIPVSFMVVYAISDVEPEEEICIMYGANVGHESNEYHNWECTCGKTDTDRESVFDMIKQTRAAATTPGSNYSKHVPIIRAYTTQQDAQSGPVDSGATKAAICAEEVITLQSLAMGAGVYKANAEQLVPTARFEEYIKEHFGVERSAADDEKYRALMTTLSHMDSDCKAFLGSIPWNEL